MDRVEVACQITFDDPAAPRHVGSIPELYLHGAGRHGARSVQAGSHRIGDGSRFPDWLHGHEHGSLDDAIRQSRNTQWA